MMDIRYSQRNEQRQEELEKQIKAHLMAYGTYVLLKWWVKSVKNRSKEKDYEYFGMPIHLRMR